MPGAADPLVLYVEAYWASPWVAAVYVALREKQLPFSTAVSMVGPGRGAVDQLHDRSFTGTAPVLHHGELWIAESSAIVEYLEEAFPTPRVLPADLGDRARARQLMSWMRAHHEPLRLERSFEQMMYPPATPRPPLSAPAQAAADSLVRVAGRLGAGPSGQLFDRFGVVDVELAIALMRLVTGDVPVPEPLAAYAAAVWARPSMREFIHHPRPPNAPR